MHLSLINPLSKKQNYERKKQTNKHTKKKQTNKQTNKTKQDMTVPFARARAKLGGSIRQSDVTILIVWWCFRPRLVVVKHTLLRLTSVNI